MTSTVPTAPALPRSDRFTRELTPTWLATTALLRGQRPPDLARVRRYVHLGCGLGETASVVAASHPNTEVWAWDPHPEHLDATRRLGEAAGLANLVVHEQRELPLDLGGPTDMVVVQDVLAAADDGLRAGIAAAVRASLRPGGLVCVTYPTLAGWTEVAPVQALLRQLALGSHASPDDLVPEVLGVLDRLRTGGARYLIERPVVAAWLDELRSLDPTELASRYLRDAFRPMSPAQVATVLAPVGCARVGSAQLTDDLDADLTPALADAVAGAPTPELRETYRDLATRRAYRTDLFRLGGAALPEQERDEHLDRLGLSGLAGPEEPPATWVDPDAWRQLAAFGVRASELHDDPAEVGRVVRVLMDAGQVHPTVANGPGRAALEACEALNAALRPDLRAVPLLGTAISAARWTSMRSVPTRRGTA